MRRPLHPGLRLTAYVDDRLPLWRRWIVEHHLRRCTRCALEVARTRGLVQRLAAAPPPEPPPHLTETLRAIPGRPPVPVDPPSPVAGPERQHEPAPTPPRPRTAGGAVGVAVAGVVLVGAAGAGAVMTSPAASWSGPPPVASFNDVLPSWSGGSGPDATVSIRPVDNDLGP